MHTNRLLFVFISIALIVIAAAPAFASDPVVWDIGSRTELLKGEARGISISDTGIITLAPEATQMFNTEQPYVWSSAIDAAGNVFLGTGHDGKLFRFGADGKGSLLFKAAELDVTALAVARDGAIFAATSPDGKVYRVTADGKSEVYFDPQDKYIWSLATLSDGSLAVGTGDNGKIYRVRAANAKPADSLLVDTNQTHVMSLAVTARGELIAGTDPGGLVLRISPEGKAFALYDSSLREIHALSPAADGSIYALALGEAAATVKAATADATAAATATVTTTDDAAAQAAAQPTPARSRNDLSNARSAVLRILPDGGTDIVWSSTTVTGFAVMATKGGVLIGTSDKGRVYSVTDDGRDTLLLQTTEGQVSSFIARGNDIFSATSNQGKLLRFGTSTVKEGSYESPVRDARLVATWGKVWWRGAGAVELQTRSGNSERPDTTWSDWSASYTDASGSQISSPKARFIQWRAVLKGPAGANRETKLDDVSLAYLPRNVAPEVVGITVLPAGVALQQQIQMPIDPNIEASGLDPSLFGVVAQAPPRRLFQKGARSIQWQAEDRNGDTLEYAVYYRALNETNFHLLKDHIRETFYTIDGASLSDGRYLFRVVASDDLDNPSALALTGERISEPVEIDNTPPVLHAVGQVQVSGDHVRAVFEVEDATGHIKRTDLSIDGSPWREVFPDDGIADSGKERYSLELNVSGPGEHTISLRTFDNSNNVGSLSVTFRR
ncbi:MAG TPA: hypothetical protein VE961_10805 [Pyrinomonadaceae bacterium]|nr:hypothetical protein [Pyrinomonadaceae bacterium]